jgi:trehalose 6-phosphate synthase
LIVATNRGPVSFRRLDDGGFETGRGAGGVVSALTPLLTRDDREADAVWVAAAMDDDDRAAVQGGHARVDNVDLCLLDLDPEDQRLHYDIVTNATLWFLHHGMYDLVRRPRFDQRFAEAWDAYVRVNEAFAGAIAERAPQGDVVLVQDIQLAVLPEALRAARPDLRIAHFTHTPFCGPNSIRVLPDRTATRLCGAMATAPAGFHSERWARAFAASTREVLGSGASPSTFVAPLGPDPDEFARIAATAEVGEALGALEELVGDRAVIVRSDRVEPSKNIVRGFLAYDRLLELHPEWRERVVFVALVYPSREGLAEYLAYRQEVEQAAARVNDRWATGDWQPILLDSRDDFERSVAGLLRYDVLLVNPIKDGLNLVCKEGPLVNRRDGVVCLSREAGAYDELHDAVEMVHPYDLEQTAAALHHALSLPADQRRAQAASLRELAAARTPALWLADMVAAATAGSTTRG